MADHDVLLGAAVIGGAAAVIAVRVAVIVRQRSYQTLGT